MKVSLKNDNYPWATFSSSLLFAIINSILHVFISLVIAPHNKTIIAVFAALMTLFPLFFICILSYGIWICFLNYFFKDILLSEYKKHHLLFTAITIIIFCGIGNSIANHINNYILLINNDQMSYFYMQTIIASGLTCIYFIKTLHTPAILKSSKKEKELLEKLNNDNINHK